MGGACAGSEHLHGFAAVTVYGDPLAIQFTGQAVNVLDILYRGAVRQVYGFGYGIVRVFLKGSLHTQMIFR